MNPLNTLLQKAATQNQAAFQQLYTEVSPKLFALCLRLVNYDNEAAEEILQEAFIKIWNKADKFDVEKGNAMAWMSTIVRNQTFDRLRSYKSRPELVEETEYETIEYTANDLQPEQKLLYRQQIAKFKDMLDELPANQRECITHSIVYGRSHSQIADEMNVPLGTVKAWLRRNIKVIQDVMSDTDAYGLH
ncbi:sigma-70 family RNA polymerase sigma factor [Cocleimonas sp. KMM 6892]|uniref:RNA polymerase sigma factor n=1 Tax=unclassified Cocleimonas TaxID=2639732 RepID=UPI002DBD027D|nr:MULTISPECIES: sigma-70 family RNA polymerase sigma factor [unclassified Cocleimonas]MEB8434209.1 sigma-70 family RNA polymerase sigma factor [Cocleimonas sp. KMM 6892]MEC4717172.1 sigma-70 family RNA polymerase sigma factor [Cocleimonas sp. KMM 6895]MEC4746481.1 sigma-70 family RNA polymerase sigma factor [Cocleimonas sp. KMM 6896]